MVRLFAVQILAEAIQTAEIGTDIDFQSIDPVGQSVGLQTLKDMQDKISSFTSDDEFFAYIAMLDTVVTILKGISHDISLN